ncbi:MAG TPA: hypothetical protein VEI50_11745 [Nitrospiraceae bacterium]|nr:hypothetical protein [Nitrospiraceae bacterium]
MATAAEKRESAAELTMQGFSSKGIQGGRCHQCGGLMVGEFCMDLLNGSGELEFLASRCVQCGEVVDPVILMNRRLQRSAAAAQPGEVLSQSVGSQVAA